MRPPGPVRRAAATLACIALSATACSAEADPDPARGGTLVYADGTGFPENLLPLIGAGNSLSTGNILIRILPTPFRTLPDYTIAVDEDLMASVPTVEPTATGQVVTYEISPAAVWSDGEPITAADFEFTWRLQRSSDPAEGGCPALIGTLGYDQIESVLASNDGRTVTVTFGSPFPDWKALFTLFPAHVMDTGDDAANCAATTTGWPIEGGIPEDISGGPWQLRAGDIDVRTQVVALTPNPRWYGEGPRLERLIYQTTNREPIVATQALQSGEVDLVTAQPLPDLIGDLRAAGPDFEHWVGFGLAFDHFDLNTRNVHLAKPEVRQAFALALDRAAIVAVTAGAVDDRAEVLNNRFYVNNQPEYVDNAPSRYDTQDIPGAMALLESAGYTIGADGVATHPRDGPLALRISTLPREKLFEQAAELAAAQLGEAGFRVRAIPDGDIFAGADRPTSLESRGFEVALFAWFASPYISGSGELYRTGGSQNYAGVSNPEVDRLLNQLTVELDPEVAAGIANAADAILWDEMVTIPLYQRPTLTAWNTEFEGIQPNATSAGILWNSEEIHLAP